MATAIKLPALYKVNRNYICNMNDKYYVSVIETACICKIKHCSVIAGLQIFSLNTNITKTAI